MICAWVGLLSIALTQVLWCVDYHDRRWRVALAPVSGRALEVGEGLIIQRNGLGYYAWLSSALIDHNWSFDNEFDDHNPLNDYVPPPTYRTPIGRRANQWSVGPALAWAPAVVPGHMILRLWHKSGPAWAADGYSLPYQLMVGGASLSYSFLGILLLYKICRRFAMPMRAMAATSLLSLGTTAFYYTSIEVSLPHGLGVTAMAGLIDYWLATYGSQRSMRWFFVGVLIGAASLVRWQLATYLILPAAEAISFYLAGRRSRPVGLLFSLSMSAAGFAIAILPQMIAWKYVYGKWIIVPIIGVCYHFSNPSFWTVLLSTDRGLFYWTPMAGLAFLACAAGLGGARPAGPLDFGQAGKPSATSRALLFVAFLVQVYFLASMWGMGERVESIGNCGGIFLARSFGFRDLTESMAALAPGLAWFFERLRPFWFRRIALAGLVFVSWNFVLVAIHTGERISQNNGMAIEELLMVSYDMIINNKVITLKLLLEPILLGILLSICPGSGPLSSDNEGVSLVQPVPRSAG